MTARRCRRPGRPPRAHQPAEAAPPAPAAAHRAAGVPAALVARRVPRRAGPPRRQPLLRRGQGRRPRSSATPACCTPTATATSPTSPSTRPGSAAKIGTRLLLTLARQARSAGAPGPHPRGAGQQPAAPRPCTRPSASRRSGMRQQVLRERRGRHRDVGPRHRRARVRRPARRPSRQRIPGTHDVGGAGMSRPPRARGRAERTIVLGIETSCDETAAAVVMGGHDVLSSVVSSQVDLHAQFGGVVPEIASRAHVELLMPVIARAIVEAGIDDDRVDAVARHGRPRADRRAARRRVGGQGAGPGVGRAVRGRQPPRGPPLRGAPRGARPRAAARRAARLGRATRCWCRWRATGDYRLLGQTIDDAAGEAFDKVARYLGLGYPGGPAIDRIAMEGDPTAIAFPRPMLDEGLDFSFAGLKTAGRELRAQASRRRHRRRGRLLPAGGRRRAGHQGPAGGACRSGPRGSCLGGGVAANSLLREQLLDACDAGRPPRLPAQPVDVHRQRGHDGRGWLAVLRADGPSALDTGAYPNLRLRWAG